MQFAGRQQPRRAAGSAVPGRRADQRRKSQNDAHITLKGALQLARAQYGTTHLVSLRANLGYARWRLAAGGTDAIRDAQQSAINAIAALRQGGPGARSSLAEGLEILAGIRLRQRENESAIVLLKEAVSLRAVAGPHAWELAHARGLLGQALIAGGHVAEGRAVLQQAIAVLSPQLGADHPETREIQRALTSRSDRCDSGPDRGAAGQLAIQPRAGLEPVSLHRAQRHAQDAGRVLLAITAEEAAFDHLCQAWHFGGEPLHGFIQRQQALIGLHRQIYGVRERQMKCTPATLLSDSRFGVVDERVPHRQCSRSQEVRLVREAP